MLQDYGLDGSVANIAVTAECCKFPLLEASLIVSEQHQNWIRNKFCQNCLFVSRQPEDEPIMFTVLSSLSLCLSLSFLVKAYVLRQRKSILPLSFLSLQVLPHYQPIPALQARLLWSFKGHFYLLAKKGTLVPAAYFFKCGSLTPSRRISISSLLPSLFNPKGKTSIYSSYHCAVTLSFL